MMLNLRAALKVTFSTPEPYLVSAQQTSPIRMLEEDVSVATLQEYGSKTVRLVLLVMEDTLLTKKLEHVNAHLSYPMLIQMENASLVMPLHSTTPTATHA